MNQLSGLKDKTSKIRIARNQPEEVREKRKKLYEIQQNYSAKNIEKKTTVSSGKQIEHNGKRFTALATTAESFMQVRGMLIDIMRVHWMKNTVSAKLKHC